MIVPRLLAALVTVLIEVPIVALLYPGQRARMAAICAVATLATNLAMNFGLQAMLPNGLDWLLVGEPLALVSEAGVYALASRPRALAPALIASGLANAASFGAGALFLG